MPNTPASPPLFADAIDIALWLERDQSTPLQERLRRDRAIGLLLAEHRPLKRVREWWRCMAQRPDASPSVVTQLPGRQLARLRVLVGWLMFLLGAVSGTAFTMTVFRYDGQHPVNVLLVVATLVGLPLMLMLLTLLLMPDGRRLGRTAAHIQDLVAVLNPGRYGLRLLERLQSAHTAGTLRALGWREARRGAFTRYVRWQMLNWSQLCALGFSGASVCTAFGLVVFTDLAFGWSTTLDVESSTVQRVTSIFSLPWHSLWPQAVPGLELVDGSRFFRLGATISRPDSAPLPRLLTGWWPFVLMCLLVYALLPRLALYLITRTRLAGAIDALLLEDPRVVALLDRMSMPRVELTDTESSSEGTPTGRSRVQDGVLPCPSAVTRRRLAATQRRKGNEPGEFGDGAAVLVWDQSCERDQVGSLIAGALNVVATSVHSIGGARSYATDMKTLEQLCNTRPSMVLVLTKSWEPPLLELFDLMAELRNRVGQDVSIVIMPLAPANDSLGESDLTAWRYAVDRLGDPSTYLERIDR